MKVQLYILSFLTVFIRLPLYGQVCTRSNLSDKFIFKTEIKRKSVSNFPDSSFIKLTILEKNDSKTIQIITLSTDFLLDDSAFINCNNSRSYLTGLNNERHIADRDYGDLIVADFNFDDKEDIAIKKEIGGNGGPVYVYYIQNEQNFFVEDPFLCSNMDCFPSYFDKKQKILITVCRKNTYSDIKMIFILKEIRFAKNHA